LIIPFISAFQANANFDQPYLFGLAAERSKLDAIIGIMVLFLLEHRMITLMQIEKIIVRVCLVYLILVFCLYLFVDPVLFKGTKLVLLSKDKGAIFMISNSIIVLLYFYSYCQVVYKQSYIYLIVMLISVLVFLVLAKARFLSVTVFICTLSHLIFYINFRKRFIVLIGGLGLVLISMVFFYAILPNEFTNLTTLFSSAFNVVLGGDVLDSSSASRITQSDIVLEQIGDFFMLGSGLLSTQWNNGFLGLHRYFYPSDIGWLGVFYLYGLIGFLILKVPLFVGINYKFQAKLNKDVFHSTMKLFFLFFFIHGIVAGYEINKIAMIIFVFSILYFYKYRNEGV
jgi:hypothetical protein